MFLFFGGKIQTDELKSRYVGKILFCHYKTTTLALRYVHSILRIYKSLKLHLVILRTTRAASAGQMGTDVAFFWPRPVEWS